MPSPLLYVWFIRECFGTTLSSLRYTSCQISDFFPLPNVLGSLFDQYGILHDCSIRYIWKVIVHKASEVITPLNHIR